MSKIYKKLKVSLVGMGRISSNHLQALNQLDKFYLIDYLCDSDDTVLNKYKYLPYKLSNNFDNLINDSSSDLYVLTTPSGLHPDQAVKLINKNKIVLSEKPMATSLIDANKILKALSANSLSRFFTVKQNRFNQTVNKLQDIISKGILGKIYNINCNVFWTRPQEYYDQAKWRGTKKLDGGAFLNQASHYFDLLIYLFGPVKSIFSHTRKFARNIEMEDSGVAVLEFISGAICTINVSMLTYDKNLEGSITLISENGTIKLAGSALNKFEFFKIKDFHEDLSQYDYKLENIYGFGHFKLYESIYHSLVNCEKNHLEGDSGLHSLKVILAAYKSSIIGKNIMIEDFFE